MGLVLLAASVQAVVLIPPAPPGYPVSQNYRVFVDGRQCPVFDTRAIAHVKVLSALRPEASLVLGVTLGVVSGP